MRKSVSCRDSVPVECLVPYKGGSLRVANACLAVPTYNSIVRVAISILIFVSSFRIIRVSKASSYNLTKHHLNIKYYIKLICCFYIFLMCDIRI